MMMMSMSMCMACVACIGSVGLGVVGYSSGFLDTLMGNDPAAEVAACAPGDDGTYEFTRREQKDGAWVCPDGWTDTGCGWDDGADLGEKQCQKTK